MKGFRDFLMRGNLVELAVAVVIGTAFTAVVKAFTAMIMDLIGKFGGVPDFSSKSVAGISVGAFVTALLSFVLTAAVVYFLVVVPFNRISARLKQEAEQPEAAPSVHCRRPAHRDPRPAPRAGVTGRPERGPRARRSVVPAAQPW